MDRSQVRALRREPILDAGAYKILRAYSTLSTCRAYGFETGTIPWTACYFWGQHKRLLPYVLDHLWDTIQHIDSIFAERAARERAAKEQPQKPTRSGGEKPKPEEKPEPRGKLGAKPPHRGT